jgi:cytochrome c biogenesis protein CcmG, thiol:disulfide interchange protein DsbE
MFTVYQCCRRRAAKTPPWVVHAILLGAFFTMMPGGSALAENLDLSAYRGKVVYLDFWASWCTPCRESFPWLGDLVHEYGAQNLVVIAVNVDHDRQRAERFLSATPGNFPIIYDPRGEIAAAYQVVGMPSAVLIDRAGKVRFHHDGFSAKRKETYAEHLQTLISEPST